MQFLFARQHLPGHLDKAAILSHSGTLGYRYTGEFCTADDETSININRRRWSVGGPLSSTTRGRFPSAFESNELDHVTMQFLKNSPFQTRERHRLTVSLNVLNGREMRTIYRGERRMSEKRGKGKNGKEKEERLQGEKWLSKTHFLRACDVLH